MEAGAEYGMKPFGLEPQRLLRLQKMHILIGQDTDSESTPFGAAMPWIVKLDKDQDFIGKWALERAAGEDLETALVGIKLSNGHVPTEGAVVLPDGRARSARSRARATRRSSASVIGMAWCRRRSRRTARDDLGRGQALPGEVVTAPFYDPEGEVLRS